MSILKAANYLAIGTNADDGSASDQALGTEVARAPILTVLFGETYFEYKALIPEEQLPKLSSAAPGDAVREVGLFWNGSSSLGTGKLLYRSTVFIKQVTVGNDLFIVLRLSPTVSTSVITPLKPDAPAALTLSSPSPQAITVEWIAPNDNGSDITKYSIQHRETGSFSWTTANNQRGLQYTINSLTARTEYDVRVRAVNSEGNSSWSSIVSRETIAEFEFNLGALFFIDRVFPSLKIYRLDDLSMPSSALLVSDSLTGNLIIDLDYDGTALVTVDLGVSNPTVYRILNFNTSTPTRTALGSITATVQDRVCFRGR